MPAEITVRSILNKTRRRDPWFLDEYTINPYSGCSFNCLYCYIRGSKYGEHMEDKLGIKINAAELLEKQLAARAKRKQYGFIVLSSATDPYLHFEKWSQLTRQMLQLILKYRFPVHIITKSDLVLRDLDLLQEINETAILPDDLRNDLPHKALITFSFSTLDHAVAKIFEPGATLPELRLNTLKTVLRNGFHAGVSMMPLLPYITDTTESLEQMFSTFHKAGTKYVFPATLTLFGNGNSDSRTLVFRAVEKHYPHLLEKYQRLLGDKNEMPAYYKQAFNKKMKELSEKYQLKNSII